MLRNRFKFPMTQDEINICIKGLLSLRNELIAEGKFIPYCFDRAYLFITIRNK